MGEKDSTRWLHSSFYRFVSLPQPADAARAVRDAAQTRGLVGSVVLAEEGISGAVAGAPEQVLAFEAAVQASGFLPGTQTDSQLGVLAGMAFKHSDGSTAPFARLSVSVKPEIVALGLPGKAAHGSPDPQDDSHVSPAAWRELLSRDDVVVLDNRNHFEFRLGHFKGAVDPGVQNFRDFVAYVQTHAPVWKALDQTVAMYCTGGIRCDKTAPWLRSLGLKVLQLDGGILNYCNQMPPAAPDQPDWLGECFVFDNRIALDRTLQETGTAAEDVFDPAHPDEAWRLARAQRLDADAA